MCAFLIRNFQWTLVVVAVLTFLFAAGAIMALFGDRVQASMDPPGKVFQDQAESYKHFPDSVHRIPFVVYGEENVLSLPTLTELHAKSQAVRQEFANNLIDFTDPGSGMNLGAGFFTVADALEQTLQINGSSLLQANNAEFKKALQETFEGPYGEFLASRLSIHADKEGNEQKAPAFYFFVQIKNPDGKPFFRTPGGDPGTIVKEKFHRALQQAFQGSSYKLLCIACDLNLESKDEGFSIPVLGLMVLTVVVLAFVVGMGVLRSWKAVVLVLLGLGILFVWIRGFPLIAGLATGGYIKPLLTNDVIIPLIFMAFGVDFFIHAVSRYKEELAEGKARSLAFSNGFTAIFATLVLVAITDGIAFGANIASSVEAVKMYGFAGVFSAGAAFFLMGIFIPLLLHLWEGEGPLQNQEHKGPSHVLVLVVLFLVQKKPARVGVLVITLLLVIGAALSISQIERRFDPKDFLSQNSDFVESLVQQRHFGENRGEEGIIYYTGEGLCTQRGMTALAQVRSSLQNNPYLARNPINGKLVLPRGEFPIIERGEKICATQDVFEITVTYTREVANLQVVRERLQKDLEPLEGIADYGITGPPYMRAAGVNAMTGSLLTTAGVAVVLIFLVLIVTFRSLWLAILTLLPMGIVVLFTFALMAQIGFALNFITATMGAVSFGVGINYPIYIVQRFRQERRQGRGRETAIAQTISHSGQAVCAAALTSMIGFAVLSAAPMPMFFTYGVLGVAMIGFSFIVAIFVLPLLLAHNPQV